MPQAYIQIPKPVVTEAANFDTVVHFRTSEIEQADSGATTNIYSPGTRKYRIDCLTTGTVIEDWTDFDTSIETGRGYSFVVVPNSNRIIDRSNATEKRLITIAGDKGTAIESRDNIQYIVNNRGWRDT